MDELKAIRKVLKKPALKYTEWNGEEVLGHTVRSEERLTTFATLSMSSKFARTSAEIFPSIGPCSPGTVVRFAAHPPRV